MGERLGAGRWVCAAWLTLLGTAWAVLTTLALAMGCAWSGGCRWTTGETILGIGILGIPTWGTWTGAILIGASRTRAAVIRAAAITALIPLIIVGAAWLFVFSLGDHTLPGTAAARLDHLAWFLEAGVRTSAVLLVLVLPSVAPMLALRLRREKAHGEPFVAISGGWGFAVAVIAVWVWLVAIAESTPGWHEYRDLVWHLTAPLGAYTAVLVVTGHATLVLVGIWIARAAASRRRPSGARVRRGRTTHPPLENTARQTPSPGSCSACGARQRDHARFCGRCGGRLKSGEGDHRREVPLQATRDTVPIDLASVRSPTLGPELDQARPTVGRR